MKRRLTLEGRTRSTAEESGRYDTGLYMPKTDEFREHQKWLHFSEDHFTSRDIYASWCGPQGLHEMATRCAPDPDGASINIKIEAEWRCSICFVLLLTSWQHRMGNS